MNWRVMAMALVFVLVYVIIAGQYLDDVSFWMIEFTLLLQLQVVHSMMSGGKGGLPHDLMGFMIVSRLPLVYMFT